MKRPSFHLPETVALCLLVFAIWNGSLGIALGAATNQASPGDSEFERTAVGFMARLQEADTRRNREEARFGMLLAGASNVLADLDRKLSDLSNLATRAEAGMVQSTNLVGLDPSHTTAFLHKAGLLNRFQCEGESFACYEMPLRNQCKAGPPAGNP